MGTYNVGFDELDPEIVDFFWNSGYHDHSMFFMWWKDLELERQLSIPKHKLKWITCTISKFSSYDKDIALGM